MADVTPGVEPALPSSLSDIMGQMDAGFVPFENPAEDAQDTSESPAEDSAEAPADEPIPNTDSQTAPDFDVEEALKALVDSYDLREQPVRETRARMLKLLDYYWQGIMNVFWDNVAKDYRAVTEAELNEDEELPKIVNIYTAYGESIIAALSNATPKVTYFPQNAESYDDVITAKTFSKLSKLIERDNQGELMLMKALFNIYNGGIVCAELCTEDDYSKPKVKVQGQPQTQENITNVPICPECGQQETPGPDGSINCPTCGYQGSPVMDQKVELSEKAEEAEKNAKKVTINLYGPLYFYVPAHVRNQADTPMVGIDYEVDENTAKHTYDNIKDQIHGTNIADSYLRWTRLSSQYIDQSSSHLVTIRKRWFRPCAFHELNDEQATQLLQMFPKGVYVTLVNDVVAEYAEEELDDCVVLSENPLYNDIYGQPLGRRGVDTQDMTTDVVNLTRDTIAQGIGITFASPTVLDFQKFKQTRARPGDVFPTKPNLGENISQSFFQTKTAVLSDEVNAFDRRLQEYGQFVFGAYPSIYGGVMQGSGGTLGEYEASRNQALQRLQLSWRTIGNWWCRMMHKATFRYVQAMEGDIPFVQQTGDTFINVWIKQSELKGSIGHVLPEYNEQFPLSWAQKKDVIQQLLTLNNPELNAILARPENAGLIAEVIGIPEIHVPGDTARNKQLYEIGQMLQGIPQQPEMYVDDDEDHVDVLKEFMNSEMGIAIKEQNPQVYGLFQQHLMAHLQNMLMGFNQQQANQQNTQGQDNANGTTSTGVPGNGA